MSTSYQRFAGICGVLAGVAGLIYLVAFLALKNPASVPSALALMAVGVLATGLLIGLFLRLRPIDEGFSLLGLIFGVGGALGAAVHAAFDLTNNLHPPAAPFAFASPVDPRGFLTFAVAGLAILAFSYMILSSRAFPHSVGYLGIVTGILLVLLYIGYLVSLNPTSPVVLFLILASGLLQPVWYLWMGWRLWQGEARTATRAVSPGGRDQ